jgi:hypothetical protein
LNIVDGLEASQRCLGKVVRAEPDQPSQTGECGVLTCYELAE